MSSVKPAPAGKRLSAEQRRRQLLDISTSLFATSGFNATTMDDIAAAAGVTKPLLYQHFDSKRALYLELVDSVAKTMLDEIGRAVAHAEGPRRQVEVGFATYFRLVANHADAFQLLFGSDMLNDPDLSSALRHVQDVLAEAIKSMIGASLDEEHRVLLAYAVVGMAEGASRYLLASSSRGTSESDESLATRAAAMSRQVADLAWAGMRSVHPDT